MLRIHPPREVDRLERIIRGDYIAKLTKFLNSNEHLRTNFNTFRTYNTKLPLLILAGQEKSRKVIKYLLSQDFVDKTICNANRENIYHIVCRIRGAIRLFSIIEKKVPHHLLLDYTLDALSAFYIACKENNISIVKRVYEILESLQVDLTKIKNNSMRYTLSNNIEVIKYVSSIPGVIICVNLLLHN